ncbi:ABC transporter permease [Ekhidna sp.]
MSDHKKISLPALPLKFLRLFCKPRMLEDVEGDLAELYERRLEKKKIKAQLLFMLDVLLLFRPGMIKNIEITQRLINYAMLNNYLKIARRNALRYKGFTLLNLLGLVVGIASSILILLWVNDEVTIDKFHTNGDKIYQLFRNMRQSNGMVQTTNTIPKPAADLMKDEYPEIDQVALLSRAVRYDIGEGEGMTTEAGRMASQEFLNIFSLNFLVGDKQTAFVDQSSIVISKSLAIKKFGENWKNEVSGSTIKLEDDYTLTVKGVFEDMGTDSSLDFEWLASAQAFISENDWVNDWGNGSFSVYFTLNDPLKLENFKKRIFNEIKDHSKGNNNAGDETLIVHKFQDYYLYSNFENGVIDGGRIDYVRIMTIVAIFILIVACVNFMNLATARSGRRSKEIGLRKVMGAQRTSIGIQFYVEALTFTTISVLLSIVVVLLLLPFYNDLVNKSLAIDFTQLQTWYFLFGITLVTALLSGSYPALLLPGLNIIESLKGLIKQSSASSYFRKGLVVFQFAISTLLIIGTSVVYKQIDFVLNKDLGVDRENLVAVYMGGDLSDRLDTYKNELKKIPEVKHVTAASGNPIDYGRSTSSASWTGKSPSEGYEINVILSDEDFIETMGIEMVAGRAFSNQLTDSTNFIINEVAAELMGFDDPIDKDLSFWGINGKIVGVAKNFHMRNMHEPIAPLIISCIDPSSAHLSLIKIKGNVGETLSEIEQVTRTLNPSADFDYEFISEAYDASYESELTVSKLANIFSVIAIFISCLGLFGLSAYTIERRSREIGVRKVHGASIAQILVLLSKDYSKLMLIAFVLSIPFGYYYGTQWLENFEFQTTLDPLVFIASGLITFVIGVLTVSFKSFQAAKTNPVNVLKDE